MSTSTILRVKRRREDNPQDALVLMCKRLKTETDKSDIASSLFVFRGTVDNQETVEVKNLIPKKEEKLKSAPSVTDILQKLRKERKTNTAENRYEVVNCLRGIKEEEQTDVYDVVDLQQKKEDSKDDINYAYDLYTAAKQDFDISMIDNLIGIENVDNNLIFGSYRDNGRLSPSSDGEESDDSNDENNWRNDYPDSEKSSIDEEAMVRAVERCDLEDDLSSDEGEDRIYEDVPDISQEDVERYGEAYAKYKAKILTEDQTNSASLIQYSAIKDDGYKDESDSEGFYYGQDEDTEQFREQYRQCDSMDDESD